MREPSGTFRTTAARAGTALTLALALTALGGCSDGDGNGGDQPTTRTPSATKRTTTAATTPATSAPATTSAPPPRPVPPPATIPSVREADTVAGPGWRPGAGGRIVADPGSAVADEAEMLAGELGLETSRGPARRGDLQLTLDRDHPGGREGYTLTVRDGRATITGSTDAGVFYGTRTVRQAVRSTGKLPDGEIRDRPDRPQRGLNLDTARKHFTAAWIEARLREMADIKLNQLALHFSDDQGFRIQSESHPEVVSAQHLTKAEVRRIVRLARRLHITVIPELDSPGHLGAVLRAHPELQLRNAAGTPVAGAVDISDPGSARLVDDLLREFAPLFPGRYWHLGGDEYRALMSSDPEAAYPGLAAAARARFGPQAGVQDLATDWLNDRGAVVAELGKRPKAWNDGFFRGGVVKPARIFEIDYWTGKEIGARLPVEYLREGWTVVNLNDEYLYYVLGQPNQFIYPTGERIYEEWSPAVLRGTEPVPPGVDTGPDRVPGARLAVWGDIPGAQTPQQVADGIRLPLAALAQRLWYPGRPPLSWPDFVALAGRVD
ncbi:glycoside hydrolase family 20 protein [Streptomyces sp. NPDC018031]|uniref:glycoside hydrolase family 20 protein n=1 Tax=Streptomyces sp. NPDC018031 TaxID=3365033 RepID=UPI0037AA97FA